MRYSTLLLTLGSLICTSTIIAQTANYDDVAVIVNTNSANSQAIGSYFQNARNIPAINMIYVNVDTIEVIDTNAFYSLAQQIEDHLNTNGIANSINYLVTTKGVPHVIAGDQCDPITPNGICGSVDASLAHSVNGTSSSTNPYYLSLDHFSRTQFGIYLVTRLTGFTSADAIGLIDRGGQNRPISQITAKAVCDASNLQSLPAGSPPAVNSTMSFTADRLDQWGWNTVLDTMPALLMQQDSVLIYVTIDLDTALTMPGHSWTNGAICIDWTESSAYSFNPAHPNETQIRTAHFISDGVVGCFAGTHALYLSATAQSSLGLEHYLDPSVQFNLAEAFYHGMLNFHVSALVIGDPKTTVVIDNTLSVGEGLDINSNYFYPNPSIGSFTYSSYEFEAIQLFDGAGKLLLETKDATVDLSSFDAGMYNAVVLGKTERTAFRLMKVD